jgi:hypothetical protein
MLFLSFSISPKSVLKFSLLPVKLRARTLSSPLLGCLMTSLGAGLPTSTSARGDRGGFVERSLVGLVGLVGYNLFLPMMNDDYEAAAERRAAGCRGA